MNLYEDDYDKPNVLNIQQLNRFLEITAEESLTLTTIIRTLAFTGMRRGKALALKWKNIDLTNGTITIEGIRDENYRR